MVTWRQSLQQKAYILFIVLCFLSRELMLYIILTLWSFNAICHIGLTIRSAGSPLLTSLYFALHFVSSPVASCCFRVICSYLSFMFQSLFLFVDDKYKTATNSCVHSIFINGRLFNGEWKRERCSFQPLAFCVSHRLTYFLLYNCLGHLPEAIQWEPWSLTDFEFSSYPSYWLNRLYFFYSELNLKSAVCVKYISCRSVM